MFLAGYFPDEYFPVGYWPKVGSSVGPIAARVNLRGTDTRLFELTGSDTRLTDLRGAELKPAIGGGA